MSCTQQHGIPRKVQGLSANNRVPAVRERTSSRLCFRCDSVTRSVTECCSVGTRVLWSSRLQPRTPFLAGSTARWRALSCRRGVRRYSSPCVPGLQLARCHCSPVCQLTGSLAIRSARSARSATCHRLPLHTAKTRPLSFSYALLLLCGVSSAACVADSFITGKQLARPHGTLGRKPSGAFFPRAMYILHTTYR